MKTIITAKGPSLTNYIKEALQYKDLLWMLSYRNIRVKYAQTFLGVIWAVLTPLLTILVLTFVFGYIVKADTDGIPPFLYALVGMCGWQYFSDVLGQSSGSVLQSQNMVKKIYFPRILLPLSRALSAGIELGILLILTIIFLLIYQQPISGNIIYLPVFIILSILMSLGGGMLISAMSIRFRDVHHTIPLLLRLGLYATPVAYSIEAVPRHLSAWFYLNPLTGIVEGFKWCVFGGEIDPLLVVISSVVAVLIFIGGIMYFKGIEATVADII